MVGSSLRNFYKIISADFILLPVSLNECEVVSWASIFVELGILVHFSYGDQDIRSSLAMILEGNRS